MLPSQRSIGYINRFLKLKHLPSKPQRFSSLSSLLGLCNAPHLLYQIHSRFIIYGLHQTPSLSSDLIARYADLGRSDLSVKIFDSLENPDASLYNGILRILSMHQQPEKSWIFYRKMLAKSIYPDESTYPFVIRAIANLSSPEMGREIHCHVIKLGFELDSLVGTALVELYRKHFEIGDARKVVEAMPVRTLAAWNAVMSGIAECGDPKECFSLFNQMRYEGFEPNSATVVSLLRSCVDLVFLEGGRFVHFLIIMNNLGGDLAVNTALLTMYCKMGSLEMARKLFDIMQDKDCAVWNLMISGYSRHRCPDMAMELLREMGKSGVRSDLFTAIASLASVGELRSLKCGKEVHGYVIRNGCDYQVTVHNSLVEMYSKCRNLKMARKVFDSIQNKTTISWSSIIKGYAGNDSCSDALLLFHKMKAEGFRPDEIMIVSLLPACVDSGALEQIKNTHGYSVKQGLMLTVSLVTALVVSYAKCGCIEMAQKLFDEEETGNRDVVSWNAMIGAYSKHGDWNKCFKLYSQMKDWNLRPDPITFLGLLTACVNSGLAQEGWDCFNEMVEIYGYRPEQEHYACMVDLLGRSGHLNEAKRLIEKMPFKPDVRVWGSLLSSCKLHSDIKVGEFAAEQLVQIEPKNAANFVLLSNIYAAAGKWDGVAKMRSFLRGSGLKKIPGLSWLEINGHVHEFRVMDQSHPESENIYAILDVLELESKASEELCL